jgi:hypothetical protein
MSTQNIVQAPSLTERLAAALAGPSLLLARLGIAVIFAWLGLIKCVPAWNPGTGRAHEMMVMLTIGKIDGQVALFILGLLQIAAAITMLVPTMLGVGISLLTLLFGLGVVFVVMHTSYLLDPATQMPAAAGIALALNMVLILAAIALTAVVIRARHPPRL